MNQTATLVLNRFEQKKNSVLKNIENGIKNDGIYRVNTCDTFQYGWDADEHQALLNLQRTNNKYHFSRTVRFQVTEWIITKN